MPQLVNGRSPTENGLVLEYNSKLNRQTTDRQQTNNRQTTDRQLTDNKQIKDRQQTDKIQK